MSIEQKTAAEAGCLYLVTTSQSTRHGAKIRSRAVSADNPRDAVFDALGCYEVTLRAPKHEEIASWAEPENQWGFTTEMPLMAGVVEAPNPGYGFVVPVGDCHSGELLFGDLNGLSDLTDQQRDSVRVLDDLEEVNEVLRMRQRTEVREGGFGYE